MTARSKRRPHLKNNDDHDGSQGRFKPSFHREGERRQGEAQSPTYREYRDHCRRNAAEKPPHSVPLKKIIRSRRIWLHASAMITPESKIAVAVTRFLSTLPRQISKVAIPFGNGD
jgi:hypothetical protein